ncbi:MAG: WG repeat-containing protein, partial [Bacteroidetes bacterium]
MMLRFYGTGLSPLVFLLLLTACGRPPGPLADQYLVIRQGNQFGYIDREGNVVVAPQFAYALPFSEGLGAVNVGGTDGGGTHMPTNGKWGFINERGSFIINPQFFSPPESALPFDPGQVQQVLHKAYIFSEGKAAVRTQDRWVYIDTTGKQVLQPDRITAARRFCEGLA